MSLKQHFAIPAVAALCLCLGGTLAHAEIINVPGDYPTIQEAINAAMSGDEVVVAPGTYFEAINFLGNAITVRSSDGPEVTTIDGTGNFHVVQCVSGEGLDTVLDGFVITGGNADGDEFKDHVGGGMLILASSPTVTNCAFTANMAGSPESSDGMGAGMYNSGGSPTVTNCSFIENVAASAVPFGGGMYNSGGSPTVTNCSFIENISVGGGGGNSGGGGQWFGRGGGMYNDASNPTVTGCIFSGNDAGGGSGMINDNSNPTVTNCSFIGNTRGGMSNSFSDATVTDCSFIENGGGGMSNGNSNPTVTNCSFIGNSATRRFRVSRGGGMSNRNSSPTVTNCTISGNSADEGGGMFNNGGSPTVTNCILWDEIFESEGTTIVTYSNVPGGWDGTGNIDADPMFVDPDNGDFRLSAGSPCIDAADNTAVPAGITTDLDGNPRFVDDPFTADTGNGAPPIVDMGSYEFQPSSSVTAMLTDVTTTLGLHLFGGVPELVDSDDHYYILQSGPGFDPSEPHPAREDVGFDTGGALASTLDIALEERANIGGPTAVVLLRNWNTSQWDELNRYALSPVDQTFTLPDIPATDYINGSSRIVVRVRTFAVLVLDPAIRGIFSHDFVGVRMRE